MSPNLPHHRKHPDFQRRKDDETERAVIHTAIAIAYALGVILLIYLTAFVAGTV